MDTVSFIPGNIRWLRQFFALFHSRVRINASVLRWSVKRSRSGHRRLWYNFNNQSYDRTKQPATIDVKKNTNEQKENPTHSIIQAIKSNKTGLCPFSPSRNVQHPQTTKGKREGNNNNTKLKQDQNYNQDNNTIPKAGQIFTAGMAFSNIDKTGKRVRNSRKRCLGPMGTFHGGIGSFWPMFGLCSLHSPADECPPHPTPSNIHRASEKRAYGPYALGFDYIGDGGTIYRIRMFTIVKKNVFLSEEGMHLCF